MSTPCSLPSSRIDRVALAAAIVCAPWSLVQAQDAAPAAPAEAGKLQSVTVTADRRAEPAKNVPSAVTTIGGEKLDVLNSSGDDIRMLSGRVPSLNIESSFGRAFPRFYIRGFGNTDFRLNASQPVSLIYDDVVLENPLLKGFPVFDMERIEVLAGPQGTLFGRNTPAGVVKFDSVKPSQKQDAYLAGTYGRFNTFSLEGAANLPLKGDWSVRLSAQTQHRDDWVTNTRGGPTRELEGYKDQALRIQALYAPSNTFTALFNVHKRELDGSARLFRANIIKPGTNDLVDDFNIKRIAIDGVNEQNLSSTGGSARLKWVLDTVNVYSITGIETVKSFSRGDVDGGFGASFAQPSGPGFIPFSSETADGIRDHRQISQEVRIESRAEGRFKWQVGAYYFNEKFNFDAYAYDSLAGNVQTGVTNSRQTNDAWAAFGSINYALTPRLTLRGGVRYTYDNKELSTANNPSLVTTNGLGSEVTDRKVNWDIGATYALTPDLNVYGRIATGFRGSSIQAPSAFGALSQAGPETIVSYEIGIKADLFERRARTSLSIFRYDVKDQQLTAVGGANNATTLVNAKKSMGQGVELSLDAYLTDDFLVSLGGSYNMTKIKDASLAVPGCGGGCTVTDQPGTVPGTYLIDGNPLPNAPKYIANVTARYGIPVKGGEVFLYTDWVYRGPVNFFLYESIEFRGKSLLEGGLRVGYNWSGGKYEVALFGRNITNQTRVTGAIDFNNLTGFVNEPRTYGVQFRAAL